METVVAAVVGGVFTLVGVYLNHHLAKKRELGEDSGITKIVKKLDRRQSQQIHTDTRVLTPKAPPKKRKDIRAGLLILFLDFVLLVLVVGIFELDANDPAWESVFVFFAIGAIPAYALFRILRGIFNFLFR